MATISTLIQCLNQQMVQARLDSLDAKPYLFGTYFPVRKVVGLNWRTVTNQVERDNVAADLHAHGATVVRKRRPVFESASGDIPKIAIGREMSEEQIINYRTALALAQDADATKLVQYWGEDIDFCFNGIQSELEYIAWSLFSNAGKLEFTNTNNATFANPFNLDYQVYDEQKKTVATDWGNSASADIIGDLQKIIKKAKESGRNPKFAFVNLSEFYKIAMSDQIKKMNSSLSQTAAGVYTPANLDQINALLANQAWLNGVQLRVIDQSITRELADGSRSSANPFADSRLVLTETESLGNTQYDIFKVEDPAVIWTERAHTVIRKYGDTERMAEITEGFAHAIPVLNTAYRNIYVRTDGSNW